jgi:hypothetical protein
MARGLYLGKRSTSRLGMVLAVDADGAVREKDISLIDRSRRVHVFEDFVGRALNVTDGIFAVKDTSAAGTPTQAIVADAADGQFAMAFSNTNEAQILTLYTNDEQNIPSAKKPVVIFRLKTVAETGGAIDSATILAFGLASAQNDTLDSVASHAWFRLSGSQVLTLESDDGTTDNDDKTTGVTLTDDTFYEFMVDATVRTDVKFYYRASTAEQWTRLGNQGVTFTVDSAALQPFVQIQKAADTNTDAVRIDYVSVSWDRT